MTTFSDDVERLITELNYYHPAALLNERRRLRIPWRLLVVMALLSLSCDNLLIMKKRRSIGKIRTRLVNHMTKSLKSFYI
jgi:hypothetical protein